MRSITCICTFNLRHILYSYVYHLLTAVSVITLVIMSVERVLVISMSASWTLRARNWCRNAVGINVLMMALLDAPVPFLFSTSNGCFNASGPRALMRYYHTCVLLYVGIAVLIGPVFSIALIFRVRRAQRMRLENDSARQKSESLIALELGAIALYTAFCVSLNVFWVTKGAPLRLLLVHNVIV